MKTSPLYEFIADNGEFRAPGADRQGPVYFPLANDAGLLSAITPDLQGDIKTDQHSFFSLPVSFEDLHLGRSARNLWLAFPGAPELAARFWAVNGRSVWQRASDADEVEMTGGFLWQNVVRTNKALGIKARVLNFVPATDDLHEIMFVDVTNVSDRPLSFVATSAVPLFARSADNVRDHRHVTSLLNRVRSEPLGMAVTPTMSFNERGHSLNTTSYYVFGVDETGRGPDGLFPTIESFVGTGDLERPEALLRDWAPARSVEAAHQGKEAVGALRFHRVDLAPGASASFTLFLGVARGAVPAEGAIKAAAGRANVERLFVETKRFWDERLSQIVFTTGDKTFNRWVRWVQLQPTLRRIFGCSFLPDFDYGRGGRGWRDLWQDILALLLSDAADVKDDIRYNFGGVRMDGSNATILGRRQIHLPSGAPKWVPEFIADRNNITRTWMDHGIWPCLTTLLYLHQTGDWGLLLETVPYFRDALLRRGRTVDRDFTPPSDPDLKGKLLDKNGVPYAGTILEHILVQTLVPFFHVGEHNVMRLEDADWNDGLDMARERGESVAFTSLYAGNMEAIADALELARDRVGWKDIYVAAELKMLFDRIGDRVDYDNIDAKKGRLESYFDRVSSSVAGETVALPINGVIADLREKAAWVREKVNAQEWIEAAGEGWYNGYYDNAGARVEGIDARGRVRMTLSGQVYPIMAGIADPDRIRRVVRAVNRHLADPALDGGVRLNTDFGAIQPNLGRAFSFAFGEKENGAVFSHMDVMYANALYQRGFAADGHAVLNALFAMASDSGRSRIFPGLPEYFNNEGRGRYAYLTGSASWYVLTLLTQVFGVRGRAGDLVIAPKLEPAQFGAGGEATVEFSFSGSRVQLVVRNPGLVPYEKSRIASVAGDGANVIAERRSEHEFILPRTAVAASKSLRLIVTLEATT